MPFRILSVGITDEQDVVGARQRARQIASLLGFAVQDQTRIATAVSELARNAYSYAKGGRVEFQVEGETAPQVLLIRIVDAGPGIADLPRILAGQYQSATGMGLGILGARRLMDQCDIRAIPGIGTTIVLKKLLPHHAELVTPQRIARLTSELAAIPPHNPLAEVQQQNHELVQTLSELRERQDELIRLNRELEDTNRGVVALYAELDEKADHLRRADEMKSRFLSNMSHEFRTPLNSIRALSQLLLDRSDGPLTQEQETQVRFVRKATDDLSELVNDLLDLAKIEAGKTDVNPVEFEVGNLFSALRGMLRPLLVSEAVNLVFEEPRGIPRLYTDEGKVSQILRNFISNALKFTERGEVRVKAMLVNSGDSVAFSVTDTGIGIAPEDQQRIFEEFAQVSNPLQARFKGTGLGLPLCRRLVGLLNGKIHLDSAAGAGSTFTAIVPVWHTSEQDALPPMEEYIAEPDRRAILVVEDDAQARFVYERSFRHSAYRLLFARSLREARAMMQTASPRAIILDIVLRGEDTWSWLAELKEERATESVPVIVVTTVADERKGLALGADAYFQKPVEHETLLRALDRLTGAYHTSSVLIIDDDAATRYVLRKLISGTAMAVYEAADGATGLRRAAELQPQVIFLDLIMPGLPGEEVLRQLKADPATAAIPVVIVTSQDLRESDRDRLSAQARAILTKADVTGDSILRLLNID